MIDKSLLVYVFWKEAFKEMVEFLREKDFRDTAMLDHMDEVLNGTHKK